MIQSFNKMNISSLVGKKIALCGEFDYNVKQILQNAGVYIVTWATRHELLALVCGTNYLQKMKYKRAKEVGIPIIEWNILETSIPCQLWTDQYAPQSLRDIIGHADVIHTLETWLKKWNTGFPEQRGVLLSGPPGIGKTTLAHIVCRTAGYNVVEMNASDCRSASHIKSLFENAARSHVVGKRRVVIMDEVDGMSSGDRGGVGELASIIRISSFPIICIANDRSIPKMKPIVNTCLDLKCSRPTKTTIAKTIYERIVKPRHLTISPGELEHICENGGNDIRQIINTLQFGATGGTKDALHRMDPFSATGLLFKSPPTANLDTRMNYVYLDHALVPLMVAEGYVGAAARGAGIDGVVRASQALDMYDILDTRIHRTQAWSLLPSAVLGVVEAASAAGGPAPFQIFPQWLGKMSKTRKHQHWMTDLARRLGISNRSSILDIRETLRARLFGLRDAGTIVDTLQELGITRDDMFEVLSETVFTGDEKTVAMDTKLKGAVTREWKKRGCEDPVIITTRETRGDGNDSPNTDENESDNELW
jgi:replication factor C subunit 1